MNSLNYPIYDADRHFYETPDAFLENLPKEFRKDFQYVQVNGRTKLAVAGFITDYIPNPTFEVVAAPGAHEAWYRGENPEGLSIREMSGDPIPRMAAFHDGDAHLKVMDEQGIHTALVLPTLASVIEARLGHKPDTIAALFHSLNKWTADHVGYARAGRLFPVPMVNLANLDSALKEVDFLLENGARVIGIRPAPVPGPTGSRSMAYPEFDPFWQKINDAGIFVVLKVSDSGYDPIYQWWTAGGKGEFLPFEKDPLHEVMDVVMGRPIADTLAAMICHQLFTRFPNIRVASLENGSRWLAQLLDRLALTYKKMPKSFAEEPLETFKRHVFVSPFYEEPIRKVADMIGVNRVLFGSDWPHPEGLADPMSYRDDIRTFTEEETRKIMSDNLKGLLTGARD